MRKPVTKIIIYILCFYDIYLYLPDVLGLFKIDFYPSDPDVLTYFDAVMILFGGIVLGVMLLKFGSRFNKWLGVAMILINVVLTPLFLFKAIP
jgi:uncharacterized membrane protein HdeD (DUF308 family)